MSIVGGSGEVSKLSSLIFFLIILWFKSWSTLALISGLIYSMKLIIIERFKEYISGIIAYLPEQIFSYNLSIDSALNGGLNAHIS